MSPRLLVLAIAPLFAAAAAHAQAPGQMAPGDTAPVAPPAAAPRPSVMDNRWSLGLAFGGLGLAAKDNPDAKLDFSIGELALRYRLTPHFELEAALAGGRQTLDNGDEGDLSVTSGTLGARYRFNPESDWNLWVMAGLGGTTVVRHDATKEERDAAGRGHGVLGLGLERRFDHFALQVEARAIAVGPTDTAKTPTKDVMGAVAPSIGYDGPQTGGELTVGASYYF